MLTFDTPLRDRHETPPAPDPGEFASGARPGAAVGRRTGAAGVEFVSYGPPDESGLVQCEVPATYGSVEIEYAAVRRGAALMDCPNRGVLRVTGSDRRDFLDRLLTQAVGDLGLGSVRESFWLNRTGRIDADLLLMHVGDELLIEVDVHQAAGTAEGLGAFVFTEDVEIVFARDLYEIAVHGPAARSVVAGAALGSADVRDLDPMRSVRAEIAGVPVVVARRDQTGGPGLLVLGPRDQTGRVWDALREVAAAHEGGRVRPAGWYAYNMARIEAGTPLFNVDFGPTNLPHETAVIDRRVSFTKGCYPGQEIVARMQNLGRPKQVLVGLRPAPDGLPHAGTQVFARPQTPEEGALGDAVGMVTSSTPSPMLGAKPIAFAIVKSAFAEEGTVVLVAAEGAIVEATVGGLCFWEP